MSVAPQWFERKTSILVPAVFAVLMKMNLYLCDRIIEPRQLSEQQVARPVKNRQHSRNQTMHCKFGRPGADDFFSETFSQKKSSAPGLDRKSTRLNSSHSQI